MQVQHPSPEDVLRVVNKSKLEVIESLELMQGFFEATKLQNEPSPEEAKQAVKAAHKQITQTVDALHRNRKSEELTEAADFGIDWYQLKFRSSPVGKLLRREIQLEKGKDWTAETWIRSGSDLVSYIAGLTNESEGWIRHATKKLIDELKHSGAIVRFVKLAQAAFERGLLEEDGKLSEWKELAYSVQTDPLIIGDEIQPQNLMRVESDVPDQYKGFMWDLSCMFKTLPRGARDPDYAHFFTTSSSLACLIMLSNRDYKRFKEIPPDWLKLNCAGSMKLAPPNAIIEGGEIESQHARLGMGENRLFRRFKLLAFVLPKLYPDVSQVSASGWTYIPCYSVSYLFRAREILEERDENLCYQMHLHRGRNTY